mgnify:CR=1 FL=1
MPSFLHLINWSEQGIRDVKDSPARLDAAKKATEDLGGRTIFFYMLMGQYDLALLSELPDDEAAAKFALRVGSLGNVRTTTLRAFTEDEYRAIITAL